MLTNGHLRVKLAWMSSELLSVCIPTRNRAAFLRDLLTAFAAQVREAQIPAGQVAFYISDNAAEDDTPAVAKEFVGQVPRALYSRNAVNIGADGNIAHVRTLARGRYHWVVGDDELLEPKALCNVLRLIQEHQPGLVLAYNSDYRLSIPTPQVFPDYRAFARECMRHNIHALVEHSLISCNIYRADCYDPVYAQETLHTHYPQLYAMIRPLQQSKASVVLPECPIITIREEPAPAVDGLWISDLDACWVEYLTWLRQELQLPDLDLHGPSAHAKRMLRHRILRHPVRFVWNNRRALLNPGAYRFVFNRLFRKRQ